jgi:hypothetical protein
MTTSAGYRNDKPAVVIRPGSRMQASFSPAHSRNHPDNALHHGLSYETPLTMR